MSKYTTLILISIIIVIVFLIGVYLLALPEPSIAPLNNTNTVLNVNDFDECIAAGNPAMESYPRQCHHGDQTYTEYIGNELEKADLIRINNPRPNQKITSPLKITGEAIGFWYFEGDFQVKLLDDQGHELVRNYVTAQGEWMTEDFVLFEGEITFTIPFSDTGTLVLSKDNSSGLPEGDDELIIPVKF